MNPAPAAPPAATSEPAPAHDALTGARITVLVNPTSGRGRAAPLAEAIEAALRRHNAAPTVLPVRQSAGLAEGETDAIVLIGGDGTLHHSIDTLMRIGAPVRIAPCGTENLFAKEFSMRADVDDVLAAIRRADVRPTDVCRRDGSPFAVMLSVGPDAAIVERVALERTGAITRLSYVRPGLAQLLRPTLPRLSVRVDGETLVDARRGWLVIANARHYAVGVNPAADARTDDGLIDVAFMPAANAPVALFWMIRARLRAASAGSVRARGRDVEVIAHDDAAPVQMDGEFAAPIEAGQPMRITIDPGALRILA